MLKLSDHSGLRLLAWVVLTSLLLFAGWPAGGFAPLLLLAFVPILALENYFYENRKTVKSRKLFFYSYLCFLLWNVFTTWWIYFATAFGAAAAIFFNTLFMATVFTWFHNIRCRLGSRIGYLALVVFWTAFEYLHLNWDLSWPWLTLGNGFAAFPRLIQWYEFTGVLGGTIWILTCNVLLYRTLLLIFSSPPQKTKAKKLIYLSASVILIPVIISELMYFTYHENKHPVNVAVVQPNIDPYNEKFSKMSSQEQVNKFLNLGAALIDSTTDYVVGPETSLPYSIWEDQLPFHHDVRTLKSFLAPYPRLQMITGVATNKLYGSVPPNKTARQFRDSPEYYDSFNTAMQLDRDGKIQLYHKSQLVIGVEKIPYPAVFKYFEKFAIDLGGASGSLGTQAEPSVFESPDKMKVAPAICYESIYGEFMTKYMHKGAQLIFIITNDGWWGDTPGYRQHLQYARLRAIETRRSIARSANTGISAFINQRGDIIQQTAWWQPVAIKQSINANERITIYTKYGDLSGVITSVIAIVLFFYAFITRFLKRREKPEFDMPGKINL